MEESKQVTDTADEKDFESLCAGSVHWQLTRLALIKQVIHHMVDNPEKCADICEKRGALMLKSVQELIDSCPRPIYLIERLWIDPMANKIDDAAGYNPHKYVFTEIEAKALRDKGRTFTNDDCWAIFVPKPEYRYTEIKHV